MQRTVADWKSGPMFVTSWERLGVGLVIADKAMSPAVRRIVQWQKLCGSYPAQDGLAKPLGTRPQTNYGLDPLYVIVIGSAHCSRPRDPFGNLIESEESSA
jgi:hypothetical protein